MELKLCPRDDAYDQQARCLLNADHVKFANYVLPLPKKCKKMWQFPLKKCCTKIWKICIWEWVPFEQPSQCSRLPMPDQNLVRMPWPHTHGILWCHEDPWASIMKIVDDPNNRSWLRNLERHVCLSQSPPLMTLWLSTTVSNSFTTLELDFSQHHLGPSLS